MTMIGLIEGRDVHYVDQNGEHFAAKIVRVLDMAKRLVSVFVFPTRRGEQGGVVENVSFAKSTKEMQTSKPGTWHWIERVE
jgi:hypothetical protein